MIVLGGSPAISGNIYTHPDKMSVIVSDSVANERFKPADKVYSLDFPAAEYAVDKIVVMEGRDYINSFQLYNPDFTLKAAGRHLSVCASAAKVAFSSSSATGDTPNSVGVAEPGKPLPHKPPTEDYVIEDYENDGNWYTRGIVADSTVTYTFEKGSDDWIIVNGTQANRWVIGTAAKAGGSHSIYISENDTANSYNITTTSVVHFYKDVTFPTTDEDMELTFSHRGISDRTYDNMTVMYSAVTSTPVAGTAFSGTLLGTYYGDTVWSQKTVKLPAATFSGKTFRIVFSWKNNNASGNQPAAAVDNITIRQANVPNDNYTLFEFGENGTPVTENLTLYLKWTPTGPISVASHDREIPVAGGSAVTAIAPTVAPVKNGLTVGPNPAAAYSGAVTFFRSGSRIRGAALHVYDASGNAVKKVAINDKSSGQFKRSIGSWDLRDSKGRIATPGTYLLKGTITTADGKKENVSAMIGVSVK